MARTQFVPLELKLIDEGRFHPKIDLALAKMQEQMLAYVEQHGVKANGAKSSLTLKIVFACDDAENGAFSSKASINISPPADPPTVNRLQGGEDQTGQKRLLCRSSGADAGNPNQLKLCKSDGSPIETSPVDVDKETGEVKG